MTDEDPREGTPGRWDALDLPSLDQDCIPARWREIQGSNTKPSPGGT